MSNLSKEFLRRQEEEKTRKAEEAVASEKRQRRAIGRFGRIGIGATLVGVLAATPLVLSAFAGEGNPFLNDPLEPSPIIGQDQQTVLGDGEMLTEESAGNESSHVYDNGIFMTCSGKGSLPDHDEMPDEDYEVLRGVKVFLGDNQVLGFDPRTANYELIFWMYDDATKSVTADVSFQDVPEGWTAEMAVYDDSQYPCEFAKSFINLEETGMSAGKTIEIRNADGTRRYQYELGWGAGYHIPEKYDGMNEYALKYLADANKQSQQSEQSLPIVLPDPVIITKDPEPAVVLPDSVITEDPEPKLAPPMQLYENDTFKTIFAFDRSENNTGITAEDLESLSGAKVFVGEYQVVGFNPECGSYDLEYANDERAEQALGEALGFELPSGWVGEDTTGNRMVTVVPFPDGNRVVTGTLSFTLRNDDGRSYSYELRVHGYSNKDIATPPMLQDEDQQQDAGQPTEANEGGQDDTQGQSPSFDELQGMTATVDGSGYGDFSHQTTTYDLPDNENGHSVLLNGIPNEWDVQRGNEIKDGVARLTFTLTKGDLTRTYTFQWGTTVSQQPVAPSFDELQGMTATVDGDPYDGFSYQVTDYDLTDSFDGHNVVISGYPSDWEAMQTNDVKDGIANITFTLTKGDLTRAYSFRWKVSVPVNPAGIVSDNGVFQTFISASSRNDAMDQRDYEELMGTKVFIGGNEMGGFDPRMGKYCLVFAKYDSAMSAVGYSSSYLNNAMRIEVPSGWKATEDMNGWSVVSGIDDFYTSMSAKRSFIISSVNSRNEKNYAPRAYRYTITWSAGTSVPIVPNAPNNITRPSLRDSDIYVPGQDGGIEATMEHKDMPVPSYLDGDWEEVEGVVTGDRNPLPFDDDNDGEIVEMDLFEGMPVPDLMLSGSPNGREAEKYANTSSDLCIYENDLPKSCVYVSSSDESVAVPVVSDDRNAILLNSKKPGTVTITVTLRSDLHYAPRTERYTVHVLKSPTRISVSDVSKSVGQSFDIKGTITTGTISTEPLDSYEPGFSYESSDPEVATVDENGRVTTKGTGKATITITANESEQYIGSSAKMEVTVVGKDIPTIRIDETQGYVDWSVPLCTVLSDSGRVTAKSDNAAVVEASVEHYETADVVYVSGLSAGTANISIRVAGNDRYQAATKTLRVIVSKRQIVMETVSSISLDVDKPQSLKVSLSDIDDIVLNDYNRPRVTYVSSDPTIATVDQRGTTTGHKKGITTITVAAGANRYYTGAVSKVTVIVDGAKKNAPDIKTVQTSYEAGRQASLPILCEIPEGTGKVTVNSDALDVADPQVVNWNNGSGPSIICDTGVAGTANVTVSVAEGQQYAAIKKTFRVTVSRRKLQIRMPDGIIIEKGDTDTLGLDFMERDGSRLHYSAPKVEYSSNDPSIASVDANSNVTAHKSGETTITIKTSATDYYARATRQVTIEVPQEKQVGALTGMVMARRPSDAVTGTLGMAPVTGTIGADA